MSERISVWIAGDQLLPEHPALRAAEKQAPRDSIDIVLVESEGRKRRLPYQRKKLVLLISAMRHFAETLRAQGYRVDYRRAQSAGAGLLAHVRDSSPNRLIAMETAEYSGRAFLREWLPARLSLPVQVLPNTQFLVGRYAPESQAKRVILETFYRAQRRHWGLLMDPDGGPAGGQWNFDHDNRKPLPRGIAIPAPPSFAPDAITQAVMAEVAALEQGVGRVDGFNLPVTHVQAQAALDDFLAFRLPQFGAYEDAMSSRSGVLFHSLLSPALNIGLLDPLDVARAAEAEYRAGRAPLNSVEGFIRQVVGWREYIYWQYHRQMPALLDANAWGHVRSLPRFFWTGDTEMACLRTVIGRVLESGYSHHIERLMVLCNFAMLAGIEPAQVNEWFLACYADAYEWVVTPNVVGMGLNADAGQTATKPYIASARYIERMSDYCGGCRFDARQRTGPDACPFNTLYWDFLRRNEARLRANPRSGPAVLGLARVDEAERMEIARQAAEFLESLEGYSREDGA